MGTFKGIIALDIDGTITVERYTLEKEVGHYLNRLIAEGWLLVFLTGRTYSFTLPVLSSLKGNYFLAVQNGAALYEMPKARCIKKHYVSMKDLWEIDPIFQKEEGGLLVESGKENEDLCFYKPHDFTAEEMEYINFRIELTPEKWVPVDSFNEFSFQEFAVGKYFAREPQALDIAARILKKLPLNVIVIRDPFRPGFHLGHVNAILTSKGQILEEFIALYGSDLPVIAAGDDYNDVEMLEKSTIKVVMKNGPEQLHALADILAPPAAERGIIQALKESIQLLKS